jgi:hypothetical protein
MTVVYFLNLAESGGIKDFKQIHQTRMLSTHNLEGNREILQNALAAQCCIEPFFQDVPQACDLPIRFRISERFLSILQ